MIAQPCAVKLVKSWSEMSWGAAKHVQEYIEALDAAVKRAAPRSVLVCNSSWNSEGQCVKPASAQRNSH